MQSLWGDAEADTFDGELGKRVYDMALLRQAQRELGIRCTAGYQC